jgi:predicted nucleic acid-binding Zn ribbon protein
MERIGKILDSIIHSLGLEKKLEEGKTITLWREAVGPEIAKHTTPIKIRDSKLFVQVSGASWRNELMFLKEKIIQRLNSMVDGEVITDIIFVAGGRRGHPD